MLRTALGLALFVSLGCRATRSGATPGGAPAAAPAHASSEVSGPPASQPRTPPEPSAPTTQIGHAKITILSTMLADRGIGEWGFCALVEADGLRVLFDTGAHEQTVLRNAKSLGVDLTTIDLVVLSHHHNDHVGGLMRLRESVMASRPAAMSSLHVARGMFEPRRRSADAPREINRMIAMRRAFEESGGEVVIHDAPAQLAPGVWVTGPIPRVHPEKNWSPGRVIQGPAGWEADALPESQSLVLDTADGLVVLSGCGHAGLINTIDHARSAVRDTSVRAVVGGFHLLHAPTEHLRWTADQLAAVGLREFFGGHCTGLEPVYRFREWLELPRGAAVVAAVGASFDTRTGIDSLALAR